MLEGVYDFIKKSEELQESMLCLIYNAIADIVSSFDEKLPIGTKSAEDVDKFLKEHDHNLAAFKCNYIHLLLLRLLCHNGT